MKIAWTRINGICLLLLGLAMTGGRQTFAEDFNPQYFDNPAESTMPTAGPIEPAVPPAASVDNSGVATCVANDFGGVPGRIWFRGEYLNWWTSGAHLPAMVSTLDPTNPAPTTTLSTLFGDREIRDGSHEGYRMDFGGWLDCNHCWGLEADYFDITGKPDSYDSGQTNGSIDGNPFPIVRAFYDPANGGLTNSSINGIGYPNSSAGRVTVDTSDYFQSAGIWFRHQLRCSEWSTDGGAVKWTAPSARTFRLDAIGGYRFARLIDTVNEEDDEFDTSGGDFTGNKYSYVNDYRTVNNFNGAELGLNAVYTFGRWSLDIVSKTAFGLNNQFISLHNQGGDTAGQVPSYDFLQESSRNRFSWIPQLTVTGGLQVMDHLKITAGYDLLYWSAIVRAADQIAVGPPTPNSGVSYPIGSLINPVPVPPTWNESHFLAQGLHLGAEVRY